MHAPLNVLGSPLQSCSTAPLTGWYRDGCCNTDDNDTGSHTVCARVTDDFLAFLQEQGNDLITPAMAHGFPGLKAGDQWCVCAPSWAQAYAVGKAAVNLALQGKNSVMPTIVRTSNNPYRWKIGKVALSRVANVEKMMPENFITEDGFGITEKCRQYLGPLMRGEDYPPYRNGLPAYVRLKNVLVKKKLAKDFKP